MFAHMPPSTNSRKRAAPSNSPGSQQQQQQMQQPYTVPQPQIPNEQFMRWGQGGENQGFNDPSVYNNMASYTGNGALNPQFQQPAPASNTQLARRPMSRHLVPTANRPKYDNLTDPWGTFVDDTGMDSQNSGGVMEENDTVERLEERAVVAKRDAQSKRKQIPPFVQKLSSFLDESKNTELIRWSDRGDSFVVLDEDEFAKTLIPELFKHNNYASFVRQLNMYGFHKRVGLSDNSMKASERKNKSPSEYYNPYFKRGHPNLLWLINKPKGGNALKKGKGTRVKMEGGEVDSDDDGRDGVEESYGGGYTQNPIQSGPRAISAAPEQLPLQRREMTVVQNQLHDIQKQQGLISTAITRLRNDNNQLYQQAKAFQTLHDRHESSINAILTFLATVYNRSLDGQNGPNIAQMFANVIPQDQQQQGNVVDIGDMGDSGNKQQEQTSIGSLSPHRRPQRLLMAPPGESQQNNTSAPFLYPQNQPGQSSFRMSPSPQSSAIEELFESPSDSPQIKSEGDNNQIYPQQNIMNLINNTNAQGRRNGTLKNMEFPDVLSHYETANGNSPLTSQQRNDMLQLMANNSSAGVNGNNNGLVSPTPPIQPNFEQLGYTQAEIDELERMQREQDAKLRDVSTILQPLSPSGHIPGLGNDDSGYFNAGDISPMTGNNLDLDQFLDPDAFYTNGDSADYNYDAFAPNGSGNFDFGLDGTSDGISAAANATRIIDAGGSSNDASPVATVEDDIAETSGRRSPSKRRKRV